MHIALFSPAWPPHLSPNGIVTYVKWMRKEMVAQGHRVSIFAGKVESNPTDVDCHYIERPLSQRIKDSVTSRLFNRPVSVFDYGDAVAAAINRVHRRDRIDVIEMEESFGWAAAVSRNTSIPMVVKLHGPAFLHLVEEDLNTPFGEEKVRREGEALAQLPVITSPSRCTLRSTLSHYALNPDIEQQVVNPISLPVGAKVWDLAHCARDTLLFVGRFDKVKGGDLVLRAFHRLLSERPTLKLVFVGPDVGLVGRGGGRVCLPEFIASLGGETLARAVSCRGRLSPSEIETLRARAFVTVVASRHVRRSFPTVRLLLKPPEGSFSPSLGTNSERKSLPLATVGLEYPAPHGCRQSTFGPPAGNLSTMPVSRQTPSRFAPSH